MSASTARVLAALKRISPSWPSTDTTTRVGKELGSIAAAMAVAADRLDALVDEIFPDTTTQLIDRWEKVTRIAPRTGDDLPTRRARVLAVLRRTSGPTIAQLEKMLSAALALDPSLMIWVEPLRSMIEEALIQTTGTVALAVPATLPDLKVALGNPYWPGVVDDTGVAVYLKLSAITTPLASLTSPKGTSSVFTVTSADGWIPIRTAFVGELAAGMWTIAIHDSGAPTLQEARILVSNNVDSAQIYNFFLYRDPALAGTPDLFEAQRLFHRTALANMRAFVIERLGFIVGDSHSLVGREPVAGA